jgi:hypothetical protein
MAEYGDTLDRIGRQFLWGPGRHGCGDNIAIYSFDVAGAMVEHYCEMQLIFDDDEWQPRQWSFDDYRNVNTWGPMPDPASYENGIPIATAVGAAA